MPHIEEWVEPLHSDPSPVSRYLRHARCLRHFLRFQEVLHCSWSIPVSSEGSKMLCSVPDGSGGSQNGLDINGHFWRGLDGSGGPIPSSEAGMC